MALLRFSATVGGFTLASRVLGFARDMLIASLLAAGPVADAFFVAFRIPNMFRRLVGEGAFAAAFVPMFAGRLERDGRRAALYFAEDVLSVLLSTMLLTLVVAEAAMPWLMVAIAPGFVGDAAHGGADAGANQFALAVSLTRLCFPYLLFMALAALLGGVLNAFYRFSAPAAAPILLNLVLIAFLLALGQILETPGHALAWGVAAAGIGQFLWLVFAGARAGISLRLPRPRLTPDVRRLLVLMLPGVLGAGVHQINLLVSTAIASFQAGAVSYLYYADRINQLPLGVVGVAVGVALLPLLSRQVKSGREADALASQNRAIEISLLLTLPATAALVAIPSAIVSTLFERGSFGAADARATADALAAFAAGLPAYVLVKVLSPGFFAREDMKAPVKIAVAALVANIVLCLVLVQPLGHVGIALATALASWLNALLLAGVLLRRRHFVPDQRLRRRGPRMVGAAAALGAGLATAAWGLEGALSGSLGARLGALALLVLGGLALYGALARLLGAVEFGELRLLMRRPGAGAAA